MATILRWFNPGCEIEVANGSPYFNLPKQPAMLENQLATLPMFMSNVGDYILVNQLPNSNYIDFWNKYYDVNFITFSNTINKGLVLDGFAPWGVSPRAVNVCQKFKECFSENFICDNTLFNFLPIHKQLFSRLSSANFFKIFVETFGNDNLYPSKNFLPIVTTDINQAINLFNTATNLYGGSVFKSLFSSSGRGVRIFRKNTLNSNILTWFNFVIKSCGGIEYQPLYNKVSDFSAHFDIINHQPVFVGFSNFATSDNGFYRSSKVKKFETIQLFDSSVSNKFVEQLSYCLQNSIYCKHYNGPLGIDCMIYSDGDTLKINPCVEINCRHSMGRLAMQLLNLVSKNSEADFYVITYQQLQQCNFQSPIFDGEKLLSGFLPLTPNENKNFVAGILATPVQQ